MADIVLATIGRCIYCGATEPETPLQKEHIVPFALGGRHVLLKASCNSCGDITKKVEQHVCRKMLGPVRVQLGYPTRRPREREKAFKVRFFTDDGHEDVEVPANEAPAMLTLPLFDPPGFGMREQPSSKIHIRKNGIWGRVINPEGVGAFDRAAKRGRGQMEIGGFVPSAFGLMLAKIGHGAAMSRFHNDQFVPFLPNIIRSGKGYISHFVGTDEEDKGPVLEGCNYNVRTAIMLTPYGALVWASVQLFAHFGAPVYVVLTGMLTDRHSGAEADIQKGVD